MSSVLGYPVTHCGWRAIAKRLGVSCSKTAMALTRKHSLPVYRIGKSPRLDEAVFRVWIAEHIKVEEEIAARKKAHEDLSKPIKEAGK